MVFRLQTSTATDALTAAPSLENAAPDNSDESMPSEYSAEALLIRVLVQEVHTAATLTAGAASAVNFTHRHRDAGPLGAARDLISDFSAQVSHWPRRILEEQLSQEPVHEINEFFNAFGDGRTSLLEFEVDAAEIGGDRAAPLHISRLASTWRQAAGRARAAVASLRSETPHILPGEFEASSETLLQVLERVIHGAPECCLADGSIVLPHLSERRRAPRRSLLQTALVGTASGEFKAFARDISSGGIGLSRMPALKPGLPIAVQLACGRSFNGHVAWSHDGDVGVMFERPLSLIDPLIFG